MGDASTGHITPTHEGEPARMVAASFGSARHDDLRFGRALRKPSRSGFKERILAQWRHDKTRYKAAELQACGAGSINPWCDDACWSLLYYVVVFQQTGDADALDDARALIRKIHDRWHDDELGGGLWHNDQRKVKSLYGTAFAYAGFGLSMNSRVSRTTRSFAMADIRLDRDASQAPG